ncbi:C40 family peptidase [bacterium]|nr:C40 family peptidase [bacterium]
MQKLINVSEANLYKSPTYKSEVTTQALLGEVVDVLEVTDSFSLVKLNDSYQDWIDNQQLCDFRAFSETTVTIRSHVVRIHIEPNLTSQTIRDVTIGRNLPVADQNDNWIQIVLPDGLKGWIEKAHVGKFPPFSRENLVRQAMEFIGYPYFWGGKTPKGLDCSGFCQLVFSLLGKDIPRDSWMQHRDAQFVSHDYLAAKPGDLYFFGVSAEKIDHVGIALGGGRIIHGNGMIRINSLKEGEPDFKQRLIQKFVAVKTFFDT